MDLVEYNCAEQFMMASKARRFGDDMVLSAILASDDPREQKRLGRQVRHFDPELWQSECENIVLHGNLAKFSKNEEMHLVLIQTGDRASPKQALTILCGASAWALATRAPLPLIPGAVKICWDKP